MTYKHKQGGYTISGWAYDNLDNYLKADYEPYIEEVTYPIKAEIPYLSDCGVLLHQPEVGHSNDTPTPNRHHIRNNHYDDSDPLPNGGVFGALDYGGLGSIVSGSSGFNGSGGDFGGGGASGAW